MKRYNLQDRVVVITGATGGLGRSLARALRDRGAKLALLDIDLPATQALAAQLGADTVAHAWPANVRDYDALAHAMDQAAKHFGGIDVVIANAGVDQVSPMVGTSPASFERVVDINLTGVWRTLRLALPHVQQRRGYLMAISSMAAFVHSPLQSHYTASKAGVWAMCNSIRLEVRHLGVDVGTVHPTFFNTPMMADVHADPAGVKLWGGNKGGLWKMITVDDVVQGIVAGIEQRKEAVVLPRENILVAKAPGLFRKMAERLGFKQADVVEAIRLAEAGGPR